MIMTGPEQSGLTVDYCGESFQVEAGGSFVLGREADLVIDDNPFLHRHFLRVDHHEGLWWLSNVGSTLAATVADEQGTVQAWISPGARMPLVFERTFVWFTAGPTTYEFELRVADAPFVSLTHPQDMGGTTTIGRMSFTPEQRLLILALCEPILRLDGRGSASLPSSAEAAERLGWRLTKFNRKLDNVCQKLASGGVRGMHGGPTRLASSRRARLVEYAVAARVVERKDLDLLEAIPRTDSRQVDRTGESSP